MLAVLGHLERNVAVIVQGEDVLVWGPHVEKTDRLIGYWYLWENR